MIHKQTASLQDPSFPIIRPVFQGGYYAEDNEYLGVRGSNNKRNDNPAAAPVHGDTFQTHFIADTIARSFLEEPESLCVDERLAVQTCYKGDDTTLGHCISEIESCTDVECFFDEVAMCNSHYQPHGADCSGVIDASIDCVSAAIQASIAEALL